MSRPTPVRHMPLASVSMGAERDGLIVRVRPDATIALLLHDASVTTADLAAASALPPCALRRCAPGQTLWVTRETSTDGGAAQGPALLRTRIALAAATEIVWLDQSHGRVLIELEGPAASEALAYGIGIDLDDHCFPVGRSEPTRYGHIAVNLARTGPRCFELVVMRSYARALWALLAARCAPDA